MATLIDNGWLYLTNDTDIMKLACVGIKHNWKWQPDITHYTGGGHYGFDLGESALTFKASRIIFATQANAETYLSNLRTWQLAGTFKLKVQSTSGGAFLKLDGTNTVFPVLSHGPTKISKIGNENNVYFEVGSQVFEIAGTPS